KVGALLHGPPTIVFYQPAVKKALAILVDRLELYPYVKGVNRAPRKEVADFSGPNNHVDPHGVAAPNPGIDLVQRSDYFCRLRNEGLLRPEVNRLLPYGKCACDTWSLR